MSRTIHYYNCYIKYNGHRTNIDVTTLIDRVMVLDPANKYRILRGGSMSMIEMAEPDIQDATTAQNRRVAIGKYRDNKPYTGQRGTDAANRIGEDVLELTSAVFVPLSRLLLVEYNHYGARPGHIVKYLNTFLPNREGHLWEFEIIAIEPERGFTDVENSRDIRFIEFKLDLTNGPIRNNERVQGRPESLLFDVIDKSVESHNVFGANVATLSFGNGRSRRDVMDPAQLVPLVRELNLEDELFESVKVKYRSAETGNVENIDLKNVGILKRVILTGDNEPDGWLYIANAMQEDFYQNGRPGENHHMQYHQELIVAELPVIIINPQAEDEDEE